MQADMFQKAKAEYESRLKVIREWKDFVPALNNNCICVIPWCEREKCEDDIKDRSAEEYAAFPHYSTLMCMKLTSMILIHQEQDSAGRAG